MPPWMNSDTRPCGTLAAYKRHQRHGEKPCEACRAAMRAARADALGQDASTRTPDFREIRNGLPPFRPYVYGASRRAS